VKSPDARSYGRPRISGDEVVIGPWCPSATNVVAAAMIDRVGDSPLWTAHLALAAQCREIQADEVESR
jgi:hypothetical protein